MSGRKLIVVTASLDPAATEEFWGSWRANAAGEFSSVVVLSGWDREGPPDELTALVAGSEPHAVIVREGILGVVPAFALGVRAAAGLLAYESKERGGLGLDPNHAPEEEPLVALFHDDLRIDQKGWDLAILQHWEEHPHTALAGFGGALGVGEEGMYARPYAPMTLARHSFGSNMEQAEAHGERWREARRVAVLDGFSQIGPLSFFDFAWQRLGRSGIVHHCYDVYLGALARRYAKETWFLPVACHHAGGRTAVSSTRYHAWARGVRPAGDQSFWEEAHRITWDEFADVLPFSVD